MTDKQVSATLQSHKEWIGNRYGGGKRADFRGTDLRKVNLEGADVRWGDFRAADLSDSNLAKADFTNADMRGCNLRGACCIGTIFVNARLEGANMEGIDLRGAIMEYAQLAGANLGRKTTLEKLKETVAEMPKEKQVQQQERSGLER
jgi:uncharacterized protein YjbI with pentapeptide repeats